MATIALCGIVSEMLSMLVWLVNKNKFKVEGIEISETEEENIFGRQIHKQGQERRVKILKGLHFIDDISKGLFSEIRNVRKRHLHLWGSDTRKEEEDDSTLQLLLDI